MKKITGKIEIDPIGKPRMTRSDKWKHRPCVMRYREYCDIVRAHFGGHLENVHEVKLLLQIKTPKSWSNSKAVEMWGSAHRQKPDIDNCAKAFMDAILKDDSGVSSLVVKQFWGCKGMINYQITLEEI